MRKIMYGIGAGLSIVLMVIGALFGVSLLDNKSGTQEVVNQIQSVEFTKLEIADTAEEREQGLQNRTTLCDTCGMLFVFEEESQLSFWMKNTSIPLDMVFIDSDGVIVTIHEDTKPFRIRPVYTSDTAAQYVLEVPSGYSQNHGLVVGTQLDMTALIDQGEEFDVNFL